jgi:hypothetical protein
MPVAYQPKCKLSQKMFVRSVPEAVYTIFYFLRNVQMDPISQSVCPWQTFPA